MTILENLSTKKTESRRAAKDLWQFTRYSLVVGAFLGFSLFNYDQQQQTQPRRIAVTLLEKATSFTGAIPVKAPIKYFKKHPHLIDQLPKKREVMENLEEVVLKFVKRESITPPIKSFPVPAKFTIREPRYFEVTGEYRGKLNNLDGVKHYFSETEIERPSILIKHTNYVFFPGESEMFQMKDSKLIRVMKYANHLIQIPGGAYFVEGDDDLAVVSIPFKGKPKVVYECKEDCRVYKLHGTPYGVVFDGEKNVKLLDSIDRTLPGDQSKSSIKDLLVYLVKTKEFEPDDYTRVLWRNNTLYVNNDDEVWIYKKQLSKWHKITPNDASAFYVFDMDGDGRDDIAIKNCSGSDEWEVYTDKKARNFWTKIYAISSSGSCKQDFYRKPDNTHLWLAPTLLKNELRKIIKK